ncbi:MAG: site-specific integrase [Planctomycetales bacterium]|nr:site-specific integrase [bacterium]UNM08186.1 MAG: site-specific integrase [Planctomycetales bacterium]
MKSLIISTVEAYLESLHERGYKNNTVMQYRIDLMKAAEFLKKYRQVKEIMPHQIERFLQSDALLLGRRGERLAPRTVQRTLRVLRQYLIWLQDNKWRRVEYLLDVLERAGTSGFGDE